MILFLILSFFIIEHALSYNENSNANLEFPLTNKAGKMNIPKAILMINDKFHDEIH